MKTLVLILLYIWVTLKKVLKFLGEYFSVMLRTPMMLPSIVIATVVGSVGVYNLGWVIDPSDHPLFFVIMGWIVSIAPTPALLYLNYLTHKRVKEEQK
jgi:hypothetical protein